MANNNKDQAPKIKSTGKKVPEYLNWGNAIRPHELETIFANCLGAQSFAQYKVMMFLTGNAEEKFDVSLKNAMNRCGLSKSAYYIARDKLIERGWLSEVAENDKVYLVIHYDKIYKEGIKQCDFLNYSVEQSNSVYTTEQCNSFITTVEQCNTTNTSEQSNSVYTSSKEGNSVYTKQSNTRETEQGISVKEQYNIKSNNINNNIEQNLKEEFDKEWGNGLKGPASQF